MTKSSEKGKYASPEGDRTWEYLAIFSSSILMFCVGTAGGWNSPSSVKLTDKDSLIRLSPSELSTLMSLVAVGQIMAPPLNSLVVDRIGRKNTMIAAGVPLFVSWLMIVAWICIGLADYNWILYSARLTAGLSQGLSYCVCPMYLGEISSTSTRAIANVLLIIMQNVGMLLSFAIIPPLSVVQNACLNLSFVLIYVGVFCFMPESPYYLMMRGRPEEAEEVLSKMQGRVDVSEELELIQSSIDEDRELQKNKAESGILSLLSDRATIKCILIFFVFSSTYHLCGYSAIMAYGQMIFRSLFRRKGQEDGSDSNSYAPQEETPRFMSDYTANITKGVVQLVSVLLTTALVDRWGRKPLIAVSGLLAGMFDLLVGSYFYVQEKTDCDSDLSDYSMVPVVGIFLIVFAFNVGLLTVQGVMISELFAPQVKAIGVCVATMNGGLLSTIGTKMYLMIAVTWGFGHHVPFLIGFALVWILTGVLLYLVPETKNKTLLDIQRELSKR